jgi:hypothetical protein
MKVTNTQDGGRVGEHFDKIPDGKWGQRSDQNGSEIISGAVWCPEVGEWQHVFC